WSVFRQNLLTSRSMVTPQAAHISGALAPKESENLCRHEREDPKRDSTLVRGNMMREDGF
ncbi:hypothetical protein NLU14_11905, partial [Marinobacter sp. 71-i]